MTDCAIGVDIGGTKCAAGIVQLTGGQIVARDRFPTQPHLGGRAVLGSVMACLESLVKTAQSRKLNLRCIGLGLPELVGPANQILSRATIDWIDIDARQMVSKKFGVPVSIEADVRTAARAEAIWGAGKLADPFLYVTVGTGISVCLVVNQTPYFGARGLTGTVASSPQLIAGTNGVLEGTPLESFAAGPSLAQRYRSQNTLFTGQAAEVLQRADDSDPVAIEVVQTAGRALGAAIAHLVNVLDPQLVVLGGGLGLTCGMYRVACESALREFVWSELHRDLPVRSAVLGEDAGWIGAALHSIECEDRSLFSQTTTPRHRES